MRRILSRVIEMRRIQNINKIEFLLIILLILLALWMVVK
jgi:hypothetical protein